MAASTQHKTGQKNAGKGEVKKNGVSEKKGGNSRQSVSKNNKGSRAKRQEMEYYDDATVREVGLLVALAAAALLILSNFGVCGKIGGFFSDLMFGVFGITAYVFPIYLFWAAAFLLSNMGSEKAYIKFLSSILLYVSICMLLQMVFIGYDKNIKLSDYYKMAVETHKGGGILGAGLTKLLIPALGAMGAYLVGIVMFIVGLVLVTERSFIGGMKRHGKKVYDTALKDVEKRKEVNRRRAEERKVQSREKTHRVDKKVKGVTFTNFAEDAPDNLHEITLQDSEEKTPLSEGEDIQKMSKESSTEIGKEGEKSVQKAFEEEFGFFPVMGGEDEMELELPLEPKFASNQMPREEEEQKGNIKRRRTETIDPIDSDLVEVSPAEQEYRMEEEVAAGISECVEMEDYTVNLEGMEEIFQEEKSARETQTDRKPLSFECSEFKGEENTKKEFDYQYPPFELLSRGANSKTSRSQEMEMQETAEKLETTLRNFGVGVTVTNVSRGPAVTRYELQPEQGVKVSKIVGLSDDIKLNLAAADIRIEAPIPGKAAIGIEVPNKENATVKLRELFEDEAFQKHSSKIAFAVGKDIGGQTIVTDIAKMPHLLIAGATGSGKSVCINTLIMSILYKAHPNEVKLIMVDPKVVELSVYNGIPHLLIPVVTDPKKAAGALNWAVAEMTDRYQKFAECNVRDLKGYNQKIVSLDLEEGKQKPQPMPQIVIIVDELADLMMVAQGEVEDAIVRLAQLARAAGIHLVIATQRPSVNVITGLIKANVPSRIAFAVSSGVDSRTIIDMNGAEKLLGKGDMLFYPTGYPKPVRVQGAFVSDSEVGNVVEFLKAQAIAYQNTYQEDISSKITDAIASDTGGIKEGGMDTDAYFVDAGRLIIEKEKASIGMLQRMFKIGFNRAARIMEQLSDAGVVGPEEGTKPRKILMTMEEFENYLER